MESKQVEQSVAQTTAEQTQEKRAFGQVLGEFFYENYAMFFAPVIVLFLYCLMLAIFGVYPFGDKYTAASYDLSAQICPFIEHLFDVMQGKSTFTYSYAIVGGADVTGTFLYFFISPFSFLFLIFGDGMVAHASSIVMACKLAAISVAGTWFAKKLFTGIPDYICVAIGVVYAYCGYTFVANTYINWMDFLIYLPFCVAAFKHFVKTNEFLPFSILMACCIYTCFSIACFSMFTVFPTLIVFGLLCVEKDRKMQFIAHLCLAFAAAILLALPVLLPALSAFLNSARGGDLFENLWYGYTVSDSGALENFNASYFLSGTDGTGGWLHSIYAKWSYILADTVFFMLTLVWFTRVDMKTPFAKFMLIAGAFTLLPTVVDEAMNLMNMGSYMSYALRFGFLNALYFLGGACLALEGLCFKPWCAYDGTPLFKGFTGNAVFAELPTQENTAEMQKDGGMVKANAQKGLPNFAENKSLYIWAGVFILVALAAFIFLIWFMNDGNYKKFLTAFATDSAQVSSLDSFSSRFAHSLGGLEVVIVFFVIVAILVIMGCALVYTKKLGLTLLSFALIAVVGVQVCFYNVTLVGGNASTQHEKIGDYQAVCKVLNAQDDSYFRVKDFGQTYSNGVDSAVNANVPFSSGSNAFSVFSSVIDADNFGVYQIFGYMGNAKNSFKSTHNESKLETSSTVYASDAFGDCFLGYKYFIVHKSMVAEAEKKSYLKKVTTLDEKGNEIPLKDGEFTVYENTSVFPLGFKVDSGDFQFVAENSNNRSNRRANQQALYRYLTGEDLENTTGEKYVTDATAKKLSDRLWTRAADVEVGAAEIKASVTAEQGEYLMLSFVASKGYTVTLNGKAVELCENDLGLLCVALEAGENELVFTYKSPYVAYFWIGIAAAVVGLVALLLIINKTKAMDRCACVIAWAGIILAVLVVAFFMVFPTGVFLSKVLEMLKGILIK